MKHNLANMWKHVLSVDEPTCGFGVSGHQADAQDKKDREKHLWDQNVKLVCLKSS